MVSREPSRTRVVRPSNLGLTLTDSVWRRTQPQADREASFCVWPPRGLRLLRKACRPPLAATPAMRFKECMRFPAPEGSPLTDDNPGWPRRKPTSEVPLPREMGACKGKVSSKESTLTGSSLRVAPSGFEHAVAWPHDSKRRVEGPATLLSPYTRSMPPFPRSVSRWSALVP